MFPSLRFKLNLLNCSISPSLRKRVVNKHSIQFCDCTVQVLVICKSQIVLHQASCMCSWHVLILLILEIRWLNDWVIKDSYFQVGVSNPSHSILINTPYCVLWVLSVRQAVQYLIQFRFLIACENVYRPSEFLLWSQFSNPLHHCSFDSVSFPFVFSSF